MLTMRRSRFAVLLLPCLLLPCFGCSETQRNSTAANVKTDDMSALSEDRGRSTPETPGSDDVGEKTPDPPQKKPEKTPGFPFTIRDSLNRTLTVAQTPKRIISLSPRNTELLFAVGAGEQVLGVTTYCNYPPEAKRITKVGGFSSASLSIEKIVSLKPDLVVSGGEIHRVVIDQLDRLKIAVVALEAENFDELYRDIRLLGQITRHEDEAKRLIQSMQGKMAKVRERVRDLDPRERVTVFYQIWDEPLAAAGPACFVGQIIEQCGGVNIITDKTTPYPRINEEVLLDLNPDVILAATMAGRPMTVQYFAAKPGWQTIRAVKNHRIHIIDGDLASRFGPRIVETAEAIAKAMYPQRFKVNRDAPASPHVLDKTSGEEGLNK